MKLDPVLLNMALSWSMKAYREKNKDSIKIESKVTGATCFIAKRKSIDVIAFRGTQKKLNDILTDLFVVPLPYAGRLCHGGFVVQHASIWKQIKKHIDPKKRTLITGHSLAGSLAELSAAKLNHPNLNVVTFGKPNTFFKGFKRPMELDTQLSIINHCDTVARVPRLCYGPSKSQQVLYHGGNGIDYIDPDTLTKKEDRKTGSITERATDHYIENYKTRLEKYFDNERKALKEDIKDLNKLADEVENA